MRLPAYTGQGSLSAGGDTLRLLRNDTGVGSSVARLGAQIGDAGLQTARADATVAAIADAEDKRISGLGDAIVREDMEQTWKAKQANLEANIDPTGKEYAVLAERAFDDHVASYEDKFSTRRGAENAVLTAKLRTQIVNRAIDVEYKTRFDTQSRIAKVAIDNATSTVAENPALFGTAMQELALRADEMGFAGRIKARFLEEGRANIEAAALSHAVSTNPLAVLKSGEGAFRDMPNVGAGTEAQKIFAGSQASGADFRTMLAIGKIESNLNPSARPIDPKTGRPLSSAKGVFQYLDNSAYGAGIDPSDTEGQAKALGFFLQARKEQLSASGIQATPGRLYMFHNVGEGVANAMLRADPSETMGSLLARVYGDRPMSDGRLWRDVVGQNNPGLYSPRVTVGQALANYERKVATAVKDTEGLINGTVDGTTDEVARARLSELLGVPVERIGAAEFRTAMELARKGYAKVETEAYKLRVGQAIHEGDARIDPYDNDSKKLLDKYAATTGIQELMLQGDERAFTAARASVSRANVIPQPYLHAARELVMSGDDTAPGKSKAFAFLAGVARDNEVAWNASQVPAEIKSRIDQYRALTEGDDAIVTPAEAMKRIAFENSPAGDSSKKAAQELFKAHKSAEIKDLTVSDAVSAVSKGLWRNAAVFSTDSATADVKTRVLFDNYKQAYEGYRIQGKDIAMSKKLAAQDVADHYKVSNVFRGTTERSEITRYPIEGRYSPVDAENPFKWIEQQGRQLVDEVYTARGGQLLTDPRNPKSNRLLLEIRLVPTARTAEEWKLGQQPSYDLMYRNPRTGLIELAHKDWRPDQLRAQQAFDEAFKLRAQKAKELTEIKASPEFSLAKSKADPRRQ